MHPQSAYDLVVREHHRQAADRERDHLVTRRRRSRTSPTPPVAPRPRRDRRTRPAAR